MDFQINDIANPKLYGDPARLQSFYAWLRAEHPVARAEPEGFRPFWVVSRHAAIREIERQPEIFNAGPRNTLMPIMVEQANRQYFGFEAGVYSLVVIDGERHQELRGLTQNYFLPKNIRKLEALIGDLARQYVSRLDDLGGACDFAADLAFWYPLRVAMTILGIDETDEARMLHLTHELFGSSDPDIVRPGMTQAEHLVAVNQDYVAFFDEVTKDRQANPRDDVATLIANGRPGDRDMTPAERMGYYIIIATAGHDTTAASIAGGLKALMDMPGEIERLRADRNLVKSFANEAIRWTAPVKHFFRNVVEDYELGGVMLRRGDHVMLSYGAATRDEAAFEQADMFRLDRGLNNHLAFGYGPHMCLGQFLAKLEIEAFFHALLDKVETIEPHGPAIYTEAAFVSGIKSLPVKYRLREKDGLTEPTGRPEIAAAQ
ncbi:cytochrome P450 [Sphingopyxis witflariensis]|uniref:Cytochrome P450 n=1 Tax=Sphingopyxis witflariensis TaxID=173675 RepID=A0A2D0AMW7_9SPHN|nr:cytochrome P450 [Sphingopyxis witflariensis]OWQ95092.1 cytochrome P450 [Sphingopyxis witflariensis]